METASSEQREARWEKRSAELDILTNGDSQANSKTNKTKYVFSCPSVVAQRVREKSVGLRVHFLPSIQRLGVNAGTRACRNWCRRRLSK